MSYVRLGLMLAVVLALGASYTAVYRAGVASERSAALTRSVQVLRERGKTNETVKNMDDAALCRQLGGVWNNAACE